MQNGAFYYETSACGSRSQIQNYHSLILPGYVWDFYVLHLIRKLLIVNMIINHLKWLEWHVNNIETV